MRTTISSILVGLVLSAGLYAQLNSKSRELGVRVSVVSMRFMSQEERDREPPVSSRDIRVRLRLEYNGLGVVQFYGSSNSVYPNSLAVARKNGKLLWDTGIVGGWKPTSPGIDHWFGKFGYGWISLSAGAVEWEILESSRDDGGESHACAVFVRKFEGEPTEILSEFYVVPRTKLDLPMTGRK